MNTLCAVFLLLLARDTSAIRPEAFINPMPPGLFGITCLRAADGIPRVLVSSTNREVLQRITYDSTKHTLQYDKLFLSLPGPLGNARLGVPEVGTSDGHILLPLIPRAVDGQEVVKLFVLCDGDAKVVLQFTVNREEIQPRESVIDFAIEKHRLAAVVGDGLYLWQIPAESGQSQQAVWRLQIEDGTEILGFDHDENVVVHSNGVVRWVSSNGKLLEAVALPIGSGLSKGDLCALGDEGAEAILVPTYQGLVRLSRTGEVKRLYATADEEYLLAGAPLPGGYYVIATSRKVDNDFLGYRSKLMVISGQSGEVIASSNEISGTLVRVVALGDTGIIATLGLTGVGIWTWQRDG